MSLIFFNPKGYLFPRVREICPPTFGHDLRLSSPVNLRQPHSMSPPANFPQPSPATTTNQALVAANPSLKILNKKKIVHITNQINSIFINTFIKEIKIHFRIYFKKFYKKYLNKNKFWKQYVSWALTLFIIILLKIHFLTFFLFLCEIFSILLLLYYFFKIIFFLLFFLFKINVSLNLRDNISKYSVVYNQINFTYMLLFFTNIYVIKYIYLCYLWINPYLN